MQPFESVRPSDRALSAPDGARRLRTAACVVAVAVLGLVAAGCSGSDSGGTAADAPATSSTTVADAATLASMVEGRGKYAVGVRTVEVTGARGRVLPVEIWYPVEPASAAGAQPATYDFPGLEVPTEQAVIGAPPAPGPFPLVVYSHGSGGLRYVSGFLTEHLASHGFVVVAPDHLGNTALDEFTGSAEPQEQVAQDRPVDVQAVIDAATSGALGFEDITPAIDTAHVGVIGHSFGGFTALTTGANASAAGGEPEVDAVVGMAPYSEIIDDQTLGANKVPTMLLSGTSDVTTPIPDNTERPWSLTPGRPLVRADISQAGHQSFTDVCRYQELARSRTDLPPALVGAIDNYAIQGCAPDLIPIADAQRVTKRLATAFLLAQLAGQGQFAAVLDPAAGADPTLARFEVKQ